MTHCTAERLQAPGPFAMLGWATPAGVALELLLRLVVGYFDGIGQTLAAGICALGRLLELRCRSTPGQIRALLLRVDLGKIVRHEDAPMSRLPLATRSTVPEALLYVWDRTATDGHVPNIFGVMANNPMVWRSYLRLGNGLWADCGLDTRTRELAILRTALLALSPYEWHQHVRIGRSAGLTDEQILGLHAWKTSPLFSAAEQALFGYIDALAASDHPPAEVHEALAAHYPAAAIVGVNLLAGFYLMTARFLAAMEVETEEPFIGWHLKS